MTDSSNRHIILAVGRYPPAHGGGGLRAHRTYQRIIKKSNFRLSVVSESDCSVAPGMSSYEGIEITRITGKGGYLRSLLEVGKLFMKYGRRNISMVHAMGMSYVAVASAIWARLLDVPLIRELTVNGEIPKGTGLFRTLVRQGFSQADLVIALNTEIKRSYLQAGVSGDRIWLRPNPVDISIFHPPTETEYLERREQYGFSEKDIVHLVLARFHPRKNQLLAIESLVHLPVNHHLLLAGPVFDEERAYLDGVKNIISLNSLGNRVHLVPEYIRNPVHLYHLADTYWVPSVLEGLPNTMLEALCTGLPVVVNSGLELIDYINTGVNGFEVSPDPLEFASAANKAVHLDISIENRYKRAGNVALSFDAKIIDDEFVKRIDSLINKKRSGD